MLIILDFTLYLFKKNKQSDIIENKLNEVIFVMKKMKNINYKSLLLILLFVVIIIFGILSYNGLLFFTSGFNNFDFLLFNAML